MHPSRFTDSNYVRLRRPHDRPYLLCLDLLSRRYALTSVYKPEPRHEPDGRQPSHTHTSTPKQALPDPARVTLHRAKQSINAGL